jgi:uncharacterized membrane protein
MEFGTSSIPKVQSGILSLEDIMEGTLGLVSIVGFIVSILVLVEFFHIGNLVSQIRNDSHAMRVMWEEELKRAARERWAATHQLGADNQSRAA